MNHRYLAPFLILAAVSAHAGEIPPSKSGILIQSVPVLNDQGQNTDLKNLLNGAQPTLWLPVFTKCRASCPVMTQALKKAASETRFQVVLFSFDPGDTVNDLRKFREREALPAGWILVRAGNAAAARAFLDQFGYNIMSSGGGFIHPNEVFVLSPRARWSGLFAGDDFSPQALRAAFDRALEIDHPNLWSLFKAAVQNPQSRVIAAMLGLLLCVGVILRTLWQR